MKTLRWLALVSSLLIVGILIAPVSSEAAPTLVIDGVGVVFEATAGTGTTTAGTCSASDKTAGYTACYQIPTNGTTGTPYGRYTVKSVSSTNPARLLIADNDGSGNKLDLFTLTGVKFQIIVNEGLEQLFVIYENKFDAAPNPAGNYLFAMRIGGYIVTGNTNGDNTDTGDRVMLTGSGIFGSTSLAVPQGTLDTGDVGGPASTTVSFSLSQTQPYNSNPCDTGSNQCTPTITQTLFFKDWNKDTLWLTNSSNGAGGDCAVTPPDVPPSPPFGLPPGPVSPCRARSGKINSFINQATAADNREANQAGAQPFTPCEFEACFPPGFGE